MKIEQFNILFMEAIRRSSEVLNFDARDYTCVVEFFGLGLSGDRLSLEEAIAKLFISEEKFFLVVDIMVKALLEDGSLLVFCRPSGHAPVAFEGTWDPSDLGPFRVIN